MRMILSLLCLGSLGNGRFRDSGAPVPSSAGLLSLTQAGACTLLPAQELV
jgi:hypothetical protein